jgi:hypothetical protein
MRRWSISEKIDLGKRAEKLVNLEDFELIEE